MAQSIYQHIQYTNITYGIDCIAQQYMVLLYSTNRGLRPLLADLGLAGRAFAERSHGRGRGSLTRCALVVLSHHRCFWFIVVIALLLIIG